MGDKIPADIRLIAIHSTTLRVDQAILTGTIVLAALNYNLLTLPKVSLFYCTAYGICPFKTPDQ